MYVKGLHELSSTQTGGPVQSSQAVILVRSQTSDWEGQRRKHLTLVQGGPKTWRGNEKAAHVTFFSPSHFMISSSGT